MSKTTFADLRIDVLDGSVAKSGVRLPEADGVIVTGRGEDDRHPRRLSALAIDGISARTLIHAHLSI